MKNTLACRLGWLCCGCCLAVSASAKDFYLTIGGGYSQSGNQASLERNVVLYQELLSEKQLAGLRHDIYFADGTDPGRDLQVMDPAAIPEANRLMAEFFGSQRDLGLTYRDHRIAGVRGETSPQNIQNWFDTVGPTMQPGDRLVLYVTSHGVESESKSNPYNTSISLWDNKKLRVNELVRMLDQLPEGVSVAAIMVQCHAGGFARFIYNDGEPDKGLSSQNRCGFFATVHDRSAAGCTPAIDEASYVEYSTYFWEAVAGHSRLKRAFEPPDYDHDGQVSFSEAHAYTILSCDTIDLPIKTSDEFLRERSRFRDAQHPDLLSRTLDYDQVLELATPSEVAVLEGLSRQLDLSDNDRLQAAQSRLSQNRRGRGRYRGRSDGTASQLRRGIARDVLTRWPELANVLNPVAVELLTSRSDDFVRAIHIHPDYSRYRGLIDSATPGLSDQEKLVKYERFIRAVEHVILRENLRRLDDSASLASYQAIVDAESGTLPAN
ncbi:MAG: hypothetical protein ACO1RT_19950 [Planctomycetaceae bacterium]